MQAGIKIKYENERLFKRYILIRQYIIWLFTLVNFQEIDDLVAWLKRGFYPAMKQQSRFLLIYQCKYFLCSITGKTINSINFVKEMYDNLVEKFVLHE